MNKKKILIIIATFMIALFLFSACASTQDDQSDADNSEDNTAAQSVNSSEKVAIKDAELEKLIRKQIDKPEGDILVEDMEQLSQLSIKYDEYPIYELDGLEYATNLYAISYYGGSEHNGKIKSIAPLANLQLLEYMNISYLKIEEAPPEFNTPVLDRVSFIDTDISDYSFLKNMTQITQLTAEDCGVTSIEFLRNMNNLERAGLEYNSISDLSPLEGKTKLKSLNLQNNQVTDISALAGCTSLENFIISYNHIKTLAPLYDLENLTEVRAYEDIGKKLIDQASINNLINAGVTVYYHE